MLGLFTPRLVFFLCSPDSWASNSSFLTLNRAGFPTSSHSMKRNLPAPVFICHFHRMSSDESLVDGKVGPAPPFSQLSPRACAALMPLEAGRSPVPSPKSHLLCYLTSCGSLRLLSGQKAKAAQALAPGPRGSITPRRHSCSSSFLEHGWHFSCSSST